MKKAKVRNLLIIGILCLFLFPIFVQEKVVIAAETKGISRLAGKDRFETAVEISKAGWSKGADTVIISRHDDYADALVSSTLARVKNAPILLTQTNSLNIKTKQEITRLRAKNIIVVGGKPAISDKVVSELKQIVSKVERIGGKDRFETAALIGDKLGNSSNEAIIVFGFNFPDALAIAPYAAKNGIPIYLTKKDKLPDVTYNKIKGKKKNYIIGSEEVISKAVADKIPNAQRIGGKDRFQTSAKIVKTLEDSVPDAFVATGENFPDALAGASLIAKLDSKLLLVKQNELPDSVKQEIISTNSSSFTILGSEKVVSKKVENELLSYVNKKLSLKVNRIYGIPKLEWTAIEGAVTYQVKRGSSADKLQVLADDMSESSYIDLNSKSNEQYYYNITAKKDGKIIHESNAVLVKADNDSDKDGISNEQESLYKTDMNKSDTDEDGLKDGEEVYSYNTNPLVKDTDKDRLNDGQEINLSGTNALKIDSDGNGVRDDLEDPDKDKISNYDEIALGSNPKLNDSDFDELSDKQELDYKTNLLNEDTDNDGFLDGNEILYKTNPLSADTDKDGIKDGKEIFPSTVNTSTIEKDERAIPSLEMKLNGENIGTVTISNVGNANPYLNKDIPGYISSPYQFYSPSKFDSAQMKFTIEKKLFDDPAIEPAIYYFNENTKLLELLPDQKVNQSAGTITVNVSHFSTYIVLNKKAVDNVWDKEMRPPHSGGESNVALAIGFALDSSGSMEWNDPDDIRKQTAKEFVDKLDNNDKAAVIDFDDYANVNIGLTNNKEEIKDAIDQIDSSGGTDLAEGMEASINELEDDNSKVKYIILLTDGQGYYDKNLTKKAKDLGIVVFTIGLGDDVDETLLKEIAEQTGGKYYHAQSSDDLDTIFDQTSEETVDLGNDKDKDGLSDYHEKRGIRTSVGEIKTDFDNPDSDGDLIKDGDELTYVDASDGNKGYFILNSNPTKKDSDNDTINDKSDPEPMLYNMTDRTLAIAAGLSYSNLNSKEGNTIGELISNKFPFPRAKESVKEIQNWSVIYGNDSGEGVIDMFTDNGLGSVAIKLSRMGKPDTIIYGLRGTEFDDDKLNDGITDLDGVLTRYTPQSNDAYSEYKSLIKDYPNAEFYLAGHSLGGRIVQDVFYKTFNRNESIFKTSIKKPLHAATFNALGYNITNYTLLENDVIKSIENKLSNYYYRGDLVGQGMGATSTAKRLGNDIGPWIAKDKNGKEITGKKTFGFIGKAVHGIDLWLDEPLLKGDNLDILD
ncbi:cell wall-binding repeat-containing protein [Priestia megaterium]|uniref:cell wall-binding repeat-containing protein n=1 Tax=Priestia megaterium TaxID=1404 RepID=UPI003D977268